MILRSRHARRHRQGDELNLTTFINLMVVLVSFLLATTVYSRIAIHELNLPKAGNATESNGPPPLNLTVIVRKNGFTVTDRSGVRANLALLKGGYDYDALSKILVAIKKAEPKETTLNLRLEPKIAYDTIIQVMDVARSPPGGGQGFPDVAIGDAPSDAAP